jgi:hypothetical protein
MTNLRTYHKTIAVGIFIALFFCFLTAVPALADECEEGLIECGIDAVVSGLFSGFQSGLMHFAGCLIGYGWCLEYYD